MNIKNANRAFHLKLLLVSVLTCGTLAACSSPTDESVSASMLKNCEGGLKLFPDNHALIDPELLPLLETMLPKEGEGAPKSIEEARQNFLKGEKERAAMAAPPPDGVGVEEHHIPGPEGAPDVRIVIYTPESDKPARPALLHIHGGAFILGFPEMNDARNRWLAKDLGAVIVSVDYRLAPEHKFPAGLNDTYAALQWVYNHADELQVDPSHIAVIGESAGGNLAAALTLMARDKGEIPIKAEFLIYPNLDDRAFTKADPACAPDTAPSRNLAYALYLGMDAITGNVSPYAFPARAESLKGLPPTFIAAGAVDGLADQGIQYASRLIAAEVPTELHIYPGAFHGFDMAWNSRVNQQFYRDLRDAIRQRVAE